MIQMQSTLAAADNSGAKLLFCIKVLGGSKRRYAGIGDIIKVSVRDAIPRGKVQNINLVKRHTKPNPQANQPGGIVEREASIHASNVMLVNSATGKGERVGFKSLDDGRKVRVFRRSGEQADV